MFKKIIITLLICLSIFVLSFGMVACKNNDTIPNSGNTQPGGDETQPGGDENQPGGDETQPGGDETQPGGDATPDNDIVIELPILP